MTGKPEHVDTIVAFLALYEHMDTSHEADAAWFRLTDTKVISNEEIARRLFRSGYMAGMAEAFRMLRAAHRGDKKVMR